MEISVTRDSFRLQRAFTISRGSRSEANVLTVRVADEGAVGWGECVPYARYGESLESVARIIKSVKPPTSRTDLQTLLPAGAARNALDCALWDLESKKAGNRAWEIAGLPKPVPAATAYTLSLDQPEAMREQAAKNSSRPLLKIKLGKADDIPRLEAVRAGAPDSKIIVDANEGWTPGLFSAVAPKLAELGVALVEQPLPSDNDDALLDMELPIPVCADESCHDRTSLPKLKGKYDMVNIKLDKTGGLTEALELKKAAMAEGYRIMVGCMLGSSLAMAPATLLAQDAEVADLDGPLLLAEDRAVALAYDKSGVHPPEQKLWG
ncbi:MAG: dipeptide epimerase [Roseovarius sp.]|nr:dipeptide epimerase [Roseovarius sp.]MCY4315295.1 dipeptide epimerase [Roseovarius sp.]